MKRTICTVITLVLISFTALSQIDTSRIEYKVNPLLRGIHQIIIDHHNVEELELGDPAGPIQPVEDLPPQEQCTLLRNVFFIHGLGGSNESWQRASMALQYTASQGIGFQARHCDAHRLLYPGNYYSLSAPADDLHTEIDIIVNATNYSNPLYNPDPDKNFLIAHSQGGVITRAMLDLNYQNGFVHGYGGIVTVASSLQGAHILNNKPLLNMFIDDACRALIAGPVVQTLPITISPRLNAVLEGIGRKFEDNACTAAGVIVPQVLSELNSAMAMDFAVGASFINDLNTKAYLDAISANPVNRDLHKVAFYGVEPNENLIWRTFNWMVQSPNSVDPWEANDDFWLLDEQVKPLRLHYLTKVVENNDAADAVSATLFNPCTWFGNQAKRNALRQKAQEWQRGVTWIDNANNGWLTIIGAKVEVPVGEWCWCYCWRPPLLPPKIIETDDCSHCQALCEPFPLISADPFTKLVWTIKESDGVVLAESAQDMPYATHEPVRLRGIETDPQNWTGSSHMQIRNDDALRRHMTKLLDGDYGDFFKLQKQ